MALVRFSSDVDIFSASPEHKQFFRTCIQMLTAIEGEMEFEFSCSIGYYMDIIILPEVRVWWNKDKNHELCLAVRASGKILFSGSYSGITEISLVLPLVTLTECLKRELKQRIMEHKEVQRDTIDATEKINSS